MHPILFRLPDALGGLELPTYGLFMAAGILLGAFVFAWLAGRRGADRAACFEAILETALVSVVAAKLVGLALDAPHSWHDVVDILLHTGGVWYVGFLSGVMFAAWRFRRIGVDMLSGLDCAAAGVAAGHAVGRLGCFFAGCCWGARCDLPWAVTFTSERAHALTGVPLGIPLHPTQLYEAGAEALLAAGLIVVILRKWYCFDLQPGLAYLATYGCLRFLIETVRDDPRGSAWGLSTSQWIALAVVIAASALLVVGWRRGSLRHRSAT